MPDTPRPRLVFHAGGGRYRPTPDTLVILRRIVCLRYYGDLPPGDLLLCEMVSLAQRARRLGWDVEVVR